MYPATVRFPGPAIADIRSAVSRALDEARLSIGSGARIAMAVGSRGIGSLAEIVGATARWLEGQGAKPFIVPAMGSHGGATAEGQAAVLESYGITEAALGVPVRSAMETVSLGVVSAGDIEVSVFMDRLASESDGVLLINRVKPHTDFRGFPESGLLKMSVIGLGKHDQALAVHGHGIRGLKRLILPAARHVLQTGAVVGGLAVVENAYERPMRIEAAAAERIEAVERELLEVAGGSMARLPVDDIDVLVVDELGKDKSGTGLDTNVIGRIRIFGEVEPDTPRIRSIAALRLTEASHGNAIGVGLADVITRELYESIDFQATYENGLTSSFAERIKIPYVAANPDEAFRAALRCAGLGPIPAEALERARIVRIQSTLELSRILVSHAVAEELRARRDGMVEVSTESRPLFGSY